MKVLLDTHTFIWWDSECQFMLLLVHELKSQDVFKTAFLAVGTEIFYFASCVS